MITPAILTTVDIKGSGQMNNYILVVLILLLLLPILSTVY